MVHILGIEFPYMKRDKALSEIRGFLQGGQHLVVTPNPEILLAAQVDAQYAQIIASADLLLPDGTGLFWASQVARWRSGKCWRLKSYLSLFLLPFDPVFFHRELGDKICGSDFFWEVAALLAEAKKKVFLFGGAPGIAEKNKQLLIERFPTLAVVGATGDNDSVISLIQETQPDFVFVALGAPKQEFFGQQILAACPSVKVTIGVGGTFDFNAGVQKRAPVFWRKCGLEWLYRLISDPRRRARRIYNATVRFVAAVMQDQKKHQNEKGN